MSDVRGKATTHPQDSREGGTLGQETGRKHTGRFLVTTQVTSPPPISIWKESWKESYRLHPTKSPALLGSASAAPTSHLDFTNRPPRYAHPCAQPQAYVGITPPAATCGAAAGTCPSGALLEECQCHSASRLRLPAGPLQPCPTWPWPDKPHIPGYIDPFLSGGIFTHIEGILRGF
jgi:hypothetical protein